MLSYILFTWNVSMDNEIVVEKWATVNYTVPII